MPTAYQYSSMKAFNLANEIKSPYSGQIIAWESFNTLTEAREYLKERANRYYEGDRREIRENLGKWSLTIDACSASILTGEEAREFLEKRK